MPFEHFDNTDPDAIPDVSDRQFFQALANDGKITQDEALAYVGPGTLPQAILTAIGQLPPADQFAAKMEITGAKTFMRTDALAAQMGQILSMSSDDLDTLWRAASAL